VKLPRVVANQFPVVFWAVSIFVLSGIQGFPVSRTPFGFDKIAHFVMFFVFCGLGWRALFHQSASEKLRRYALLGAFILAVAYGALDELHQVFVPGRSPDLYDLVADALGAAAYVAWHRVRAKHKLAGRESPERQV